ncbi:MAG: proline--tRNA ligase [Gammaproteobacteria bacterium]
MRTSKLLLATLREAPGDAEILSHQLMLRAGLIRKLGAGLYTWLPLGLRILKKIEAIIREEMQAIDCQEIFMPAVQPAELWQETGRWEQFGPLMLKMKDRHEREYCFGPTHEEVVTDLARKELRSYKQLPLSVFQIQTKFRDEIRPRFGLMRAREFLMKDAYSFHLDQNCLQKTYDAMYQAYSNICTRLGLKFRAVLADTGAIGGSHSHEFHVLADTGEDLIAYTEDGSYAANVELARAYVPEAERPKPQEAMRIVDVPNITDSVEQAHYLGLEARQMLKTFLLKSETGGVIAVIVGAESQMNWLKVEKLPQVLKPYTLLSDEELASYTQAKPGYMGPIGLLRPLEAIYADLTLRSLTDFVCGLNQNDQLAQGVNWGRDLPEPEFRDLRQVARGDLSPITHAPFEFARGIEVGHVFQLGLKYSQAMQAEVLNDQGKRTPLWMGCYGFGVSRVMAAAIEQNQDTKGILWPAAMAPFKLAIVPLQANKNPEVLQWAEKIYAKYTRMGIECLLEDRDERPGVVFADLDLIGIPHRIVLSDKTLKNNQAEYKSRTATEPELLALEALDAFLEKILELKS